MTIHDIGTYQELGTLAPDPDDELEDDNCKWCGDYYCRLDCRPPRPYRDVPDGPQGREHVMDLEERGL